MVEIRTCVINVDDVMEVVEIHEEISNADIINIEEESIVVYDDVTTDEPVCDICEGKNQTDTCNRLFRRGI